MAFSPISSWQIEGEKVTFYFLGLQNHCKCSHEIRRHLLLERKAMTNLGALKSRDISLLMKVCIIKGMVFLVVRYGCESWIIKKTECQRTNVFKLWC